MGPVMPQPGAGSPPSFGPGGPGGIPGLPPGVSQEQFDAAVAEVDTFFKNMSEEEMNEFLNFAQELTRDIESGKVDINDLLPPGMLQPPQAPQPAPKPVGPQQEERPQPMQEAHPEKPKTPALRNKSVAQQMLKNILDRIGSIRTKAASYERVADTLKPWNKKLDDLTYYVHVISDKEHVDQLISDKELLPLHDMLKELSDMLTTQEPLLQTPEFGVEEQDPVKKERSKKALKNIIAGFETAFTTRSIITNLELLMKKLEPELLKKRKEAEAAQERATKDAESRKGQQPAPSHIRSQETGRGGNGRGFYDQYYSPSRPSTSYSPSRYTGDESRPSLSAPSSPAHAKSESPEGMKNIKYTPKKDDEKKKKEAEEKAKKDAAEKAKAEKELKGKKTPEQLAADKKKLEEEERKKREDAAYVPTTEPEKKAVKYLENIEKSFTIMEEAIDKEELLWDMDRYFSADAPPTGRQAQADAVKEAQTMNVALAELTRALRRIARDVSFAENSIRKSPSKAHGPLQRRLEAVIKLHQDPLNQLYGQGLALLRKANRPEGLAVKNKISMHLAYAVGANIPQAYRRAACNTLLSYLEDYELVYNPKEQQERVGLTATLNQLQAPEQPAPTPDDEADGTGCPIQ